MVQTEASKPTIMSKRIGGPRAVSFEAPRRTRPLRHPWLQMVAALILLGAASCGVDRLPGDAERQCLEQAEAFGPELTVAGAFDTNVEALRGFTDNFDPKPGLWPELPNDSHAVICFLDGRVPRAPPGGEPYNRAVVGIAGEDALLLVAGYRDTIRVTRP
jgi:hypothetical protein